MAERPGAAQPQEPAAGRPLMPTSYGIAAPEAGGLLPWSAVVAQLERARNYWVSTTRPDGRPHAAPVWGLWLDGAFLFATDPASRKGRNLAARADLVVHLESGDDVVILEGTAEPVTDPEERRRFSDAYDVKYHFRPDPDDPGTAVYRLRLTTAYAWFEQDFPTSATKWSFAGG